MIRNALTLILFISFYSYIAHSQETSVKGKITDAETGEPIPFASVIFTGTFIGGTTDFDGYYHIKITQPVDSIFASYVGYAKKTKAIILGVEQTINFQLLPESYKLSEVVISLKENPAYAIIRNAVERKPINDWKKLQSYQYEAYTKIEIDVDNISEEFKNKKIMKRIARVVDSIEHIAGEDGKPILPIFISESISNCYFRTNPERRKEEVLKTQLTGVGVGDESFITQLTSTSFKEYNFYQNWISILGKDFISPLADGWKISYEYYLEDSIYIGNQFCYQIEVTPKRSSDLAFSGTIWITKEGFALKQLDLTVNRTANINYVEKMKVRQELDEISQGIWFPIKTRILIDMAELTRTSAGMLAKFYISNKDFTINKPHDIEFYNPSIVMREDMNISESDYWSAHRHDSLTSTEKHVYMMIDSIKNVPIVKTYIDVVDAVVNGYKKVGKIDIGPYLYTYAHNRIEGDRFRIGFRTNPSFSKKWILKGYVAYGTRDRKFKYGGEINHIFKRYPWTILGGTYSYDIEQVGLMTEDIQNNSLMLASSRWGRINKRFPFFLTEGQVFFQTDVTKKWTQRIAFRQRYFEHLYDFEYYKKIDQDTIRASSFGTSEIIFETQYSKEPIFLQKGNSRIKIGMVNSPVLTFKYVLGIKNSWGGDFDYHKFTFNITHSVNVGHLGRSYYSFTVGFIPSRLPYQLLYVPLGNQTIFYNTSSFNMMRYFEFVTDRYISFHYVHRFEGLFFNGLPLVKKWKWRMVATADAIYGTLHNQNKTIIPDYNSVGVALPKLGEFSKRTPYVELGYGVENIFKFLRITAVHRLTYLDNPYAKKFGVMVSAHFRL